MNEEREDKKCPYADIECDIFDEDICRNPCVYKIKKTRKKIVGVLRPPHNKKKRLLRGYFHGKSKR